MVAAVDDAVAHLIGRRNSMRFKQYAKCAFFQTVFTLSDREIRVLGELLYNVLTTGVGLQSPGEEHCLIHKVTSQVQGGGCESMICRRWTKIIFFTQRNVHNLQSSHSSCH